MCGVRFAKFMLIFFNTIFVLTGIVLVALGLIVRFVPSIWDNLDVLSESEDSDANFEYGIYFMIAVGGFILITSILGCCGAIKENACMLGTFVFILIVVLLAEIAAGALLLIYRDDVEKNVLDELEDRFREDYTFDDGWSSFASTINFVQNEFECCGVKNAMENYGNRSFIPYTPCGNASVDTVLFPPSCFEPKEGETDTNADDLTCSDVILTNRYTPTCDDEIKEFFERWAIIFVAIAFGFACLQIFGIIFAICVCRIGSKDD